MSYFYIAGSGAGPYKIGSTTRVMSVRWHQYFGAPYKHCASLGIPPLTRDNFRILRLWEGQGFGVEDRFKLATTDRRLKVPGRGKNGTTRMYITEWYAEPLERLAADVEALAAELSYPFEPLDPEAHMTPTRSARWAAHAGGRPATGSGESVGIRLHQNEMAALDSWIATNDNHQTRPAAIRAILKEKLNV